ncbi:hypothetical protein AB4Y85_06855 [Microvirga sp. 2YAF29]|uniref:hypothetical protein n=1 Tax=Microvirga sp. 2YAF29 TaxID=3233031 RepID=UPI003F95D4A9
MNKGSGSKAGLALVVLGLTALAGCSTSGDSSPGLGEMLLTGGATRPPPQQVAVDDVYCPPVEILDGGSAIQVYAGGRSGDSSALRSQVAITNLARECQGQPDGSTLVKVGVEGRALLGVGGGAGRFNVPVQIVVKSGSGAIANRSRQTSVAIPSGDTQASFAVIEGGIVIPAAYANTFEIEVGLGSRAAAGRRG